jgi:hypothetical protein
VYIANKCSHLDMYYSFSRFVDCKPHLSKMPIHANFFPIDLDYDTLAALCVKMLPRDDTPTLQILANCN